MRKKLPSPRRKSLDLAAEYQRLGRISKESESRMREIKSAVIDAGGRIETKSGILAIEYASRRHAPSVAELEEAGMLPEIERRGLLKQIQVQILRVIGKKAA